MTDQEIAIFKLFADDKNMVPYRPKLSALLASPTAALLLGQICYWWDKMGGVFYKFKDACNHKLYVSGESWCESLGWTKTEFDKALAVIGTRIKEGVKKKPILATDYPIRKIGETDQQYMERLEAALKCLVIYWVKDNVTYYQVNVPLLVKCVNRIYSTNCETLISLRKSVYSTPMRELAIRRHSRNAKTAIPLDSETNHETTQETKIESNDSIQPIAFQEKVLISVKESPLQADSIEAEPTPSSGEPPPVTPVTPHRAMMDAITDAMVGVGKWDKSIIDSLSAAAETGKNGKKKRSPRQLHFSNLSSVASTLIGMGIKADEIQSLIVFIRDMAVDNTWSSWSINTLTGDKSVDHISAWRNAPGGKYVSKKKPAAQPEERPQGDAYKPYVPNQERGQYYDDINRIVSKITGRQQ